MMILPCRIRPGRRTAPFTHGIYELKMDYLVYLWFAIHDGEEGVTVCLFQWVDTYLMCFAVGRPNTC